MRQTRTGPHGSGEAFPVTDFARQPPTTKKLIRRSLRNIAFRGLNAISAATDLKHVQCAALEYDTAYLDELAIELVCTALDAALAACGEHEGMPLRDPLAALRDNHGWVGVHMHDPGHRLAPPIPAQSARSGVRSARSNRDRYTYKDGQQERRNQT